jgi:hypothetical protein
MDLEREAIRRARARRRWGTKATTAARAMMKRNK